MTTILTGDCRLLLAQLPAESVHTCITSPPFFRLRSYLPADHPDKALELGGEATVEAYVGNLVEVMRGVRRVLRPDGTAWLNLDDSFARNPKKGGSGTPTGRNGYGEGYAGSGLPPGIREKSLIGVPWRVALALIEDSWILRCDGIWNKVNCKPQSARDRPTRSHEYWFMFSKSARYHYDREAVLEPARTGGRNRRSVWSIPVRPGPPGHPASFPPDLVRPLILAGCPLSGTVLDPFGGSGTVGLVAQELGRRAVLLELKAEYAELAVARLGDSARIENGVSIIGT